MKPGWVFCLLGFWGLFLPAAAQCPVTDFTLAVSACRNQAVEVFNSSAPGTYSWDFCSGDFQQIPSAQLAFSLAGANGRPGIELVYDTKWYAFVTGTFTSLLYRVDFDNGLQAAPTAIINLGNLGGAINQPGQIRVINQGGQWYGILHNTTGELLRLDFGAQVSNTPVANVLINGVGSINSGLAIGKDPVNGYVALLSNAANQFSVIRLGNLLTAPNPLTDVLTTAAVPNPNNLGDVDLIQVCGNWYGLADNLGNGNIYRLDFGASLFSIPSITQVQSLTAANPGRLRWAREGENFYFLALALDGTLTRGSFGTSVTNIPSLTPEGSLGVLPASMYGLGMVKENSVWTILGINQANGQVFRIEYVDNCSASPKTSPAASPIVSYASAGTYSVSLENTSGSIVGVKERSITVSGQVAPDIDFTSLNNCAMSNVQFTSVNSSGNIVNYNWNFGDSQTSGAVNPSHSYAAAGTYQPRLVVTASNACINSITHPLTIYNPPVADFSLPPITPICTNQTYTFTNTSSYDLPSNPIWEWRVNGVLQSAQADLTTTFAAAAPQEIRLKAKIPGCENEMIKNIGSVQVGPTVDFVVGDDCALNAVPFTNTSSGVDAGFSWNFGDGTPSSPLVDPLHSYPNPGTYAVSLTGSNVGGCQNQTTKSITIYSNPQPDFSVGLPPFSCSNTPTPFQNTTPPLTDSNITSWSWSFGDPLSGTSTQRDPSFTYTAGGNYSVTLTASSDQGCSQSINKPITIGTSPVADFVLGPACVNQATQFTDISSGGVQSRSWQIGSGAFITANPTYIFSAPGNYSATLTVTAAGGCTSFRTKPVSVPPLPVLVMNMENPCAGQPTTFTLIDATVPPVADGVIGWQWNIAGTPVSGNPAVHTISLTGMSPYTVTTTHTSGCVYTQSGNVDIHPTPMADFSAAPDRGDPPLTVQFQNLSTGASQYLWSFSGKTPGISTVVSPAYTFVELGEYTATLAATNSFGCTDIHSMPIQVLLSSVDLELTSFALSPDPLTGKSRATVTIKNSSNIPITSTEIALHLSEKAVVNESLSISLLPGASVTSTLSFTFDPSQFEARFVCAEILSEKDVQQDNNRKCISLDEEDYVFAPYPNPSAGPMQVDWVSEKSGTVRITVFNSQGRQEYQWDTPSAAGLNQSIHDLAFLAAGIYLVTIQTSTTIQTMRFIRF